MRSADLGAEECLVDSGVEIAAMIRRDQPVARERRSTVIGRTGVRSSADESPRGTRLIVLGGEGGGLFQGGPRVGERS
jgi:hypothetical protein